MNVKQAVKTKIAPLLFFLKRLYIHVQENLNIGDMIYKIFSYDDQLQHHAAENNASKKKWTGAPTFTTNLTDENRSAVLVNMDKLKQEMEWDSIEAKHICTNEEAVQKGARDLGPQTLYTLKQELDGPAHDVYFAVKTTRGLIFCHIELHSDSASDLEGKASCFLRQINNVCLQDEDIVGKKGPYFFIAWLLFSEIKVEDNSKRIAEDQHHRKSAKRVKLFL